MSVSKNKKTNTWYFRLYTEDKYGIRKQQSRYGFLSKKEAQESERSFLLEKKSTCSEINFEELYKEFETYKFLKIKKVSFRKLQSVFKNHLLPYFGKYIISEISHKEYIKWQEIIEKKGFQYKYKSTLQTYMVQIFNYAIDFYDLEKNVPSKVGNFKKQNIKPKVAFWTYEEYKLFIQAVDDIVYKILFHTLYFTGIRIGECLALNWNDLKNDTLYIDKTLAKEKDANGDYIITSPKTKASDRTIKLDNKTITNLNKLKEHYSHFVGFSDKWFIFGGLNPLSQSTVNRKRTIYCEKSKVKRIRIHDFRHSHASLLLSRGVPIPVISKRLGHSNITTTLNTYSHLMPEDENKAIKLLNDL